MTDSFFEDLFGKKEKPGEVAIPETIKETLDESENVSESNQLEKNGDKMYPETTGDESNSDLEITSSDQPTSIHETIEIPQEKSNKNEAKTVDNNTEDKSDLFYGNNNEEIMPSSNVLKAEPIGDGPVTTENKPEVSETEPPGTHRVSTSDFTNRTETETQRTEKQETTRKGSSAVAQRLPTSKSFSNSMSLRSATYKDWLKKKSETDKRKEVEKQKQLEAQQKLEEKKAKREESAKIYDSWNRKKTVELKSKKSEINKLKETTEAQKKEKEEKIREAQKMFDAWKRQKDEKLKDMRVGKKESKQKEIETAESEKKKKEDGKRAFEAWKRSKSEVVKVERKRSRSVSEQRATQQRQTRLDKDEKAMEAFESWLERKEAEKFAKIMWDLQKPQRDETIPWLPPNPTVAAKNRLSIKRK